MDRFNLLSPASFFQLNNPTEGLEECFGHYSLTFKRRNPDGV